MNDSVPLILQDEYRRQCSALAASKDADQLDFIDTTMANLEAALKLSGVQVPVHIMHEPREAIRHGHAA